MSRFRKVDPRIWNDERFSGLSERGKLVFLFTLTHPHMTSLGAMRATVPGMAAELGTDAKAFAEAFAEVLRQGLLEHDPKASFVGVPKFLKYNRPESPNVVKAWAGALDLIPECDLKTALAKRVKGFAEGFGEAFVEALPEGFTEGSRKTCPNPEPEQEQEQEQEQDKPDPAPKARRKRKGALLTKVTAEMLADKAALAELYRGLAERCEYVDGSRDGELRFLQLAEHCLERGGNPAALFVSNVKHGRWYGTRRCEDLANERMKELQNGGSAVSPIITAASRAMDSADDALPAGFGEAL